MRNLTELTDSALVDMLAEQTAKFTQLFRNYSRLQNNREYQSCKETIQQIVVELRKRGMFTQGKADRNEIGRAIPPSD